MLEKQQYCFLINSVAKQEDYGSSSQHRVTTYSENLISKYNTLEYKLLSWMGYSEGY